MKQALISRIHDNVAMAMIYGWTLVHLYKLLFPR